MSNSSMLYTSYSYIGIPTPLFLVFMLHPPYSSIVIPTPSSLSHFYVFSSFLPPLAFFTQHNPPSILHTRQSSYTLLSVALLSASFLGTLVALAQAQAGNGRQQTFIRSSSFLVACKPLTEPLGWLLNSPLPQSSAASSASSSSSYCYSFLSSFFPPSSSPYCLLLLLFLFFLRAS